MLISTEFRRIIHNKSHYLTYSFRILLIFFLSICMFYTFYQPVVNYADLPHLKYLRKLQQNQKSDCVIPQIDPWDPSILAYYSKPDPFKCETKQAQVVKSFENGILSFDPKAARDLRCLKISIKHDENVTDLEVLYGDPIHLDFSKNNYNFKIDDEFFEIHCDSTGILKSQAFKYHYAQIVRKNETNKENKKIEPSSAEFPSVIMIGFDSMSRSNFIRQMPNTYKYMMNNGFVDMKGHMKIHDNTYGNTIAILTGKRGVSVQEFPAEMQESWNMAFDDIDFVWKDFNNRGYVTMFAEDRPDIGTFTYKNLLLGFLKQPTDHYMRPYWLAAYWSMVSRRSTSSCYDAMPQHKIQLNYLEKFLEAYEGKRKFAYWWTQDMSHGFLNLIGKTDDDYEHFFRKNEKMLNDSVVIVFSDHGHRYDRIRETVIGRIESRMPFHAVRIPEATRKKFPWLVENLEKNSKLMTTQFDVNDSLRKIARGEIYHPYNQTDHRRSYSYFDLFPKRLGCQEAGIPSDYCPCFSEIEIPKSDAEEAANKFSDILNGLLENTEKTEEYEADSKELKNYMCAPFELANIDFSSVRLPMTSVVNDPKSKDAQLQSFSLHYHIVVQAKQPSMAILETTMEHNLKTDKWSLLGEIDRNNKYGNTSFCVNDRVLKKICHCISRRHDSVTALL